MKNILILEDSGDMFFAFAEYADKLNFKLFKAYQISDAIDILQNNNIDLIIVDLNVPPVGLSTEEIDNSSSGRLSGWLWLKNYLFKEDPDWKKRTIIYSEYLYILYEKEKPEILNNIVMMEKSKYLISDVIEKVKIKLNIK